MLRLTEEFWDRLNEVGDSDKEGSSVGFRRGLDNWSNRVIEKALPGERAKDLRGVVDSESRSLDGIVGIKSVRRRPRYPLAQPAAIVGVPNKLQLKYTHNYYAYTTKTKIKNNQPQPTIETTSNISRN